MSEWSYSSLASTEVTPPAPKAGLGFRVEKRETTSVHAFHSHDHFPHAEAAKHNSQSVLKALRF